MQAFQMAVSQGQERRCSKKNLVITTFSVFAVAIVVVVTIIMVIYKNDFVEYKFFIQPLSEPMPVECPSCPDWMRAFAQILVQIPAFHFLNGTKPTVSLKIYPKTNEIELSTFNLPKTSFVSGVLFSSWGQIKADISYSIKSESYNGTNNLTYKCTNNINEEHRIDFCDSGKLIHEKEIELFSYLFHISEFLQNDGRLRMSNTHKIEGASETRIRAKIAPGETIEKIQDRIMEFEEERQKACECQRHKIKDEEWKSFALFPKCIAEVNEAERTLFQKYFFCHGHKDEKSELVHNLKMEY